MKSINSWAHRSTYSEHRHTHRTVSSKQVNVNLCIVKPEKVQFIVFELRRRQRRQRQRRRFCLFSSQMVANLSGELAQLTDKLVCTAGTSTYMECGEDEKKKNKKLNWHYIAKWANCRETPNRGYLLSAHSHIQANTFHRFINFARSRRLIFFDLLHFY